jgi:hypothetical protein
MANWYIKIARNLGIPRMEDYDGLKRNNLDPYTRDPRSLVNAEPMFGGEQRRGYPKGIQSREEPTENEKFDVGTNSKLIDKEFFNGEGIGGQDNTFTDPVDDPEVLSRNPDPSGPHNMHNRRSTIYNNVRKKSPGLQYIRKI